MKTPITLLKLIVDEAITSGNVQGMMREDKKFLNGKNGTEMKTGPGKHFKSRALVSSTKCRWTIFENPNLNLPITL